MQEMALNLSPFIAGHARFRPEHLAVVFEQERLTYREHHARISRLAAALQQHGVVKGDRVATVVPNHLELLQFYWACAVIGAVMVPLSPLLAVPGARALLGDARPRVVLVDDTSAEMVAEATAEWPDMQLVSVNGARAGVAALRDWLAQAPATPQPVVIEPEDTYNIMYSSGTTGMPKGIMHSHRVRAESASLMGNAWRMTPESVVLHTGAIVFNGAMVTLLPCVLLGATYILHRSFDAEALIETVAAEGVTHLMLVPSQIVAVLNAPNFTPEKMASIEMLLSLGAPLHVEHKNQLEAALPNRFFELYGLTEGFHTILDKNQSVRKRGSVGTPPVYTDMRIVREDGSNADVGEVGEIVGRSPMLMQGYYGRPDLTAAAVRDGWLYTGDLGKVDDEGYLYLVDRKKDMIDSGGVKIYPRDVEEVVVQHPDVLEAAVFGVPDAKWGETPVAAVVLRKGASADTEALKAWINARVGARYQRVQQVLVYDAFPRNAAGKIVKRDLRDPFWVGQDSRI